MEQTNENKEQKKFRFKELKLYASTEWLADNKKKYRQVFDRYQTSYIYAELSFYNRLFDRESWDVSVQLKCFRQDDASKEVCVLNVQRKISKHENISFVREGWGNKKDGVFWKRGTYYWEAYVDGELVATKYFYVEDKGKDGIEDGDPYIALHSVKMYEGKYDDVNEDDRVYLKTFSSEQSRYIYLELILDNLNIAEKWNCEIFVKFYNEARELKGQVVRLNKIEKDQESISLTAGWGSNIKGSWRYGNYSCEIVFMDNLLASIPFSVEDENEEGFPLVYLPSESKPLIFTGEEDDHETLEELYDKLDELVGLDHIKSKVKDQAKYIEFVELRKERGFAEEDELNLHSVFIGNPGTGKTTVAKMLGKIYKKMGVLSKGHVLDVDRADLVGEYIGQTAPKVKQVFEKARGGVLFIDEAYSLARANDDSKDFGREVVEMLVKEMSDGDGDMVVIAAGYPKEMQGFLNSNPGLKSRFKLKYHFDDYLPNELMEIAKYACEQVEVVLSDDAKISLEKIIINYFRKRDKSFGNGRFIFDIIEKAKINLGLRVMEDGDPENLDDEVLETIRIEDIEKIDLNFNKKPLKLPIDEELLNSALQELNSLIGMEAIKRQINETVKLVRYKLDLGEDVLNSFHFHTIFIGNPGTGKTTVARILCKIYKALGILERGHMVETDRQGLVAGFVGQTAIKTAAKIDEAIGGVLFIDEAYALSKGSGVMGDYGNEAIQTLLKRMEDERGQFFIFVAGYPLNMESFLKMNPGLTSRFDKTLKFDDYSTKDLLKIAKSMISNYGLELDKQSEKALSAYLVGLYRSRDKYFGNARVVRSIIGDIKSQQNLRLARLSKAKRKLENLAEILPVDIEAVIKQRELSEFNKPTIGFKKSD